MAKITLSWKDDNREVQIFNIYRSTSPISTNALPQPLTQIQGEFREIEDFSVKTGNTYYYRVGAVVLGKEAISEEVQYKITGFGESVEFDVFWDSVIALIKPNSQNTDIKDSVIWSEFGTINYTDRIEIQDSSSLYRELQVLPEFTAEIVYEPSDDYTSIKLLSLENSDGSNSLKLTLNSSGILEAKITEGLEQFNLISEALIKDTKYNIALVKDSQDIFLFLDGVLQDSLNTTTDLSLTKLYLNSDSEATPIESKAGNFYEVRITNSARYLETYDLQDTFPEIGPIKAISNLRGATE